MPVEFFAEDVRLPELDAEKIDKWVSRAIVEEDGEPGDISIVFCSDDKLLEYNEKYLNHDYYTDVITFDYTQDKTIMGDILISLDRVKENAESFSENFERELRRVMIHGVLHLCGYKDDTEETRNHIRTREDYYLDLHSKM